MAPSQNKKCPKCKKIKLRSEYGVRKRGSGRVDSQPYCKACSPGYHKDYYHQHKEASAVRLKRNRVATRLRKRQFVLEYLKSNPCVDCGERDPLVLEFDHRSRGSKELGVADMANRRSLSLLWKEMKKCDVRCANCHRRRTAKQFKWYKYTVLKQAA